MTRHPAHPEPGEYERFEDLTEGRRREVLLHAEVCAPCREALTRHDPTAIFALLSLAPMPEFSLGRLGRDVDAAIDAVDRVPRARRLGWRVAASIAASLALALVFGYQALQDDSLRIAGKREGSGSHSGPAAAGRGVLLPALGRAPERGVELISSPGEAEVVDFAVGETHVVMIFDRALDI